MFGYGSDRPSPDDRLIADLEKSAKAGTMVLLPQSNRGSIPSAQLEHLKGLHRAPLIQAPHARSSAVVLRAAKLTPDDLLLPAPEFAFELEPVDRYGVTTRIVHVVQSTQGRAMQLRVTVYSKYPKASGWLVTPPCKMVDLLHAGMPRDLISSRTPQIGVLMLGNEMYWAAAALIALTARARAERATTRH